MKFKSDIEVQAGLKDSSGAVGTSGQVLSSTASGVSWITQSISGYVPYTGATANVNLGAYSITADSFIKVGGNSTQYLKADGSVSTAMNSRIEANFVATSGQTTFVTPYEVGQIDVYYNGSKLYPNEFTATNGTDVVLAQSATLGAQISIIKYVSSFTTTSIRNETTFTTTAGQTTFAVNYSPGQVDVFYNGSKLNISEFTAADGTSVVLGFACAAGESIVIDSYVNQISGASGTANKVAKFTGAASLGDSQITDNGNNVGIANANPIRRLEVASDGANWISGTFSGTGNTNKVVIGNLTTPTIGGHNAALNGWSDFTVAGANINFSPYGTTAMRLFDNGNLFIGASPVDNGNRLQVSGNSSFSGNVGIGTTSPSEKLDVQGSILLNQSAGSYIRYQYNGTNDWVLGENSGESSRNFNLYNYNTASINFSVNRSSGNVGIGTGANVNARLHVDGQDIYLTGNADNRIRFSNYGFTGNSMGAAIGYVYGVANTQEQGNLAFYTNPNYNSTGSLTERMRITSGGNVGIGTQTITGLARGLALNDPSNCGIVLKNNEVNKGYLYNSGNNIYLETTGGAVFVIASVGGVYVAPGATSWTSNSDNRLKDINYKIENAVDKLCTLNPVSFSWKTDESKKEVLGLIAQDVEKVFPQVIDKNKLSRAIGDESEEDNTEYLGVRYQELIPVLVKAIQELKAEIEILKNK